MKGIIFSILLCFSFFSCDILNKKKPADYFGVAALNCNLFALFGEKQLKMEMEQKAYVYNEQTKKTEPATTFKESMEKGLIERVETNYKKIKNLSVTDDSKAMIEGSISLHEFVLEKFKNDYVAIAQMKDENKPAEEIQKAIADFDQKYTPIYQEKYKVFLDIALAFAKRNDIPVSTY